MGISISYHTVTVNKMVLRTSYLYNGYSYTSSESNFWVPKLLFCIKSLNCIKSLKIILFKLLPYLPLSQGPTTVYLHFVAKWRPENVPPYFIYYNFTCPRGNLTGPAKLFYNWRHPLVLNTAMTGIILWMRPANDRRRWRRLSLAGHIHKMVPEWVNSSLTGTRWQTDGEWQLPAHSHECTQPNFYKTSIECHSKIEWRWWFSIVS